MLSHGHFWKMACHEGLFIYHGLLLPVVGCNGCPIGFFLNFYGQPWRSNILNIIFFSSHLFAARTVPWVVARGSLRTNTTKKMLHSSISSHGGLVFRCPFRTAAEPGWSDEWMVLGTRVFGSSRFPCPSRTVRCFFQSPFLILGSSLDENPCISLYDLEGSNKKYVFIVYTRKHNPCSNPWFLSRPQMPSTPVAPWCLQRACNTAGNFCEMKRLCRTICFPYHHKKRMMHPKHPKNNLERADAFRDFFCPFACPFPRLWSAVVWRHGIAKYIFIPQRETPGVLFFSNMRP